MGKPAGPVLQGFLWAYSVGGVALALYASAVRPGFGIWLLIAGTWVFCCVKLGNDQDRRRANAVSVHGQS